MSPITLSAQVTEVLKRELRVREGGQLNVTTRSYQAILLAETDLGDGTGDFAGDESATTARRLVVEEDTVGGMHAVGLA